MPQEFLASFAVDIDEAGVSRLQTILNQNRELSAKVSSAFGKACYSMEHFLPTRWLLVRLVSRYLQLESHVRLTSN